MVGGMPRGFMVYLENLWMVDKILELGGHHGTIIWNGFARLWDRR